MAAPKGNQYWKLGHDFGRPKKYTPEELLKLAYDYAEWCEANPLQEDYVHTYQGIAGHEPLKKMRAMTIQGFSLFANFDLSTFYLWEKDEDYIEIITRIRNMIFAQKFEGAAAELLNPNIIARELGLQDKSAIEHSGGITWQEERTYQTPDVPDETHN